MSTRTAELAREQRKAKRAWTVIILITGGCLGIQAVSIRYDLRWHTLQYTSAITVNDKLIIEALGVGAAEAGFRVGDRVLDIDGKTVTNLLEYRDALNHHQADTWSTIVLERNDRAVTVSALVESRRLDLPLVALHLIATSLLLIGTLVALKRYQDRAARLFYLNCLALGLYFALQDKEAVGLVSMQIFVLSLESGLALHFFLNFPRTRWLSRTPWWLTLYVPSLILMGLTMQAFARSVRAGTGIWYSPSFGFLSTLSFSYLTVTAGLGLVSTAYVCFTSPRPVERRQLQWVVWGLSYSIAAGVADTILTAMHQQSMLSSVLLLLGVMMLPVSLAHAILRHHLLKVEFVLSRSMVYGFLTATLFALYLLVISLLSTALGVAVGSESYLVVVFLSAFLIGILANPLRSHLQTIIDLYFFRRQVDFQRVLIRWSETLSTSIRFSHLAELLLQQVPQQLMIERAWLLVLNEEETRFEPIRGGEGLPEVGIKAPSLLAVPASSALTSELVGSGAVLLAGDDEREANTVGLLAGKGSLQGEQCVGPVGMPLAWKQAEVRLAVPLTSGEQLVGIYLLGAKRSGDVYSRHDLDLLRTLGNQAAIAIANARLYERVHAFSHELEDKVRERTKELRDFVSAVYHELSTPMASIRGYTELLLEQRSGPLEERQARYLWIIRRNVERLTRLVADLADVSRLDGGRMIIHPEPIDLDLAVEEALATARTMIEEKGLRVNRRVLPETTKVLGDPQRVVQILTNLISNACRYTQAGGQIDIVSTYLDGVAEITIRDTGIGIQVEDLDHIFERFYRSADPIVQQHPGTGLGLAITKALVQLHGGDLWVKSKAGTGSTFGFTLPLATVKDGITTEHEDLG